jgi:hypothetical protein
MKFEFEIFFPFFLENSIFIWFFLFDFFSKSTHFKMEHSFLFFIGKNCEDTLLGKISPFNISFICFLRFLKIY